MRVERKERNTTTSAEVLENRVQNVRFDYKGMLVSGLNFRGTTTLTVNVDNKQLALVKVSSTDEVVMKASVSKVLNKMSADISSEVNRGMSDKGYNVYFISTPIVKVITMPTYSLIQVQANDKFYYKSVASKMADYVISAAIKFVASKTL